MMSFFEIVSEQLAPLSLELAFLSFFLLGFLILRADVLGLLHSPVKKAKTAAPLASAEITFRGLRKKLEEENHAASLFKDWRAAQAQGPTPKDLLKQIVQAFVEAEPGSLVEELMQHIKLHPEALANTFSATTALDAVARSGRIDILTELWEAIPQLGIQPTACMYDVLLGGFASAGKPDKVREFEEQLVKEKGRLSARGYSLVIKGFLKNGMCDKVLSKILAMQKAGFDVPGFAVAQFFRNACEAGRTEEMFHAAKARNLDMSAEALSVILEDCAKSSNLKLAQEVELMAEDGALYRGIAEGLMKVYATAGDQKAFKVFKRTQDMKLPLSENLCMSLMARCAESQFVAFAEEIMAYARSSLKMTVSLYSLQMKVYAHSGMYSQACDLYDQIRADGVEPDAMMYGCLMKFAVECNRTDLLNEISQKVPSLDIQHYMFLIRSAGQQFNVERALELFQQLKDSGLKPDVAAYNCVLDVCVKAGNIRQAHLLVKEMRQLNMVDIITYNTLLKGFCSKGDFSGAKKVLQEIQDAGMKPNDVSYNSLINTAVSSGKFDQAWDIVSEMEKKGIDPDRYTISIMLKSLKKVRSPKDTARCFDFIERSKIDVCSDGVLVNSVLETCVRNKDNQRLEAFLQQFEKSDLRPSVPVFGSVIKGYSSLKRIDKCWEYWNELQSQQPAKHSDIVTGCMLDALVCNKEVDKAVELFMGLKQPNMVLYSILLKGFANSNQPQRAMEFWREMCSKGMKINLVAYNSILDAQARVGNTDEICEILEHMASTGTRPDGITHSVIVKGHCVKGELDKAFQALKGIQQCNLDHDAVVYNTLLDACSKHRRHDLMQQLLEGMETKKVAPTNFTLGILIKHYARNRQLDKAFEALEKLPKQGKFQINEQVWMCLMCSCLNNGEPKKAIEIYEQLKAAQHDAAAGSAYETLVSGLVRNNDFAYAIEVVEKAYGLRAENGSREQKLALETSKHLDLACLEQLFARLDSLSLHKEFGLPLLEQFRSAKLPVTNRILALAVSASRSTRN
mmetsp:Transcript_89631/g.159154  ORF Transcript_89631/g.159154 Transcript_89631/m.159154 type:complete len:1023 (-) Transcript_89631:143-3211(-)